ncbi:MAG TPA: hypothetical protein VFD73_17310, partial [Gemmatimonadales bacterium]|nr:hypothetical protein [Gemmatimonadales bacterium]
MKTALLLPLLASLGASPASSLLAASSTPSPSPRPVLLVIANQDFFYREYSETRRSLEASGLAVQVAAPTTLRCTPAPGTGQPAGGDGGVTPNLTVARARASDYSAIVFVGGWGSSMYQYAF